jgi:hypothetical protein
MTACRILGAVLKPFQMGGVHKPYRTASGSDGASHSSLEVGLIEWLVRSLPLAVL